ncbi:MAG: DNA translocase FtsK 4TM domain-containing protein [Pseudomonadota bacterium]
MAYQTRGREPLFDANMQEAIEKRSKELIGIGLILAAMLFAAMFWSFNPDDPSFLVATDAPVQNWLGRFGASLAAPLLMIMGVAAWGIPAAFVAWGLRFAFHRGQERALARAVFLPIWIALVAVYAASVVPPASWAFRFDMGGLFGETALAVILSLLPVSAAVTVKIVGLLAALAMVALGLFVMGFTRLELTQIGKFAVLCLVMIYAQILTWLGKAGVLSVQQLAAWREKRANDRAAREEAQAVAAQMLEEDQGYAEKDERARVAAVVRAEPAYVPSAPVSMETEVNTVAEPARSGLLGRLMPKPAPMPEPELIDAELVPDLEAPENERVQAKISDAIRSRMRGSPGQIIPRSEPKLTRRGPEPLLVRQPQTLADGMIENAEALPLTEFQASTDPDVAEAVEAEIEMPSFVPPAKVDRTVSNRVVHPKPKKQTPSKRAKAEAQPGLQFEEKTRMAYEAPALGLLRAPDTVERHILSDEALEENARMLESVLDDYGVKGDIVSVRPGPVVTMYELEPAPGLKASRVIGLADDIARSMSALSARVSTVPGRSVIGIELPNESREMVVLREILSGRDFDSEKVKLPLALGKDIGGAPVVANLAKMPHLLIAGTTGSGKSVAINTMILSLLYKLSPEECRLIMIDPKMLELSVYDGIPHLLSPVVTDPKKAVVALKWVVGEMEERYRKMSKMGVRNIDGYNGRVKETLAKGELFSRTVQTGFDDDTGEPVFETEEFTPEVLPYIVVIVDEMADLMMVAGKEIEACIQRLAQMARASGIHLIMATQRPSVDVITGTIKANFPTRISFQVTSKIDSRTILGEMGAEQLLGMGDMLYMAGGSKITRVHGPFCSDEEVEEIVNHLKSFGPPEYMSGVVDGPADDKESDIDLVLGLGGNTDGEDALYDTAVQIVIKDRKCSTSYIQRKLAIGYNKAARLVEQMEDEGLVSAANHVGKREILVPEQA